MPERGHPRVFRSFAPRSHAAGDPGYGNVLADRGTITIDFSTDPWTVLFEAGPHPFFNGGYGPLCAYLASG